MSFAMIVRADDGGLGSQTWEIARHLHPDRILIVRVPDEVGGFHPARYDSIAGESSIAEKPRPGRTGQWPSEAELRELIRDVDRVFTVEGCYNDRLIELCASGPELVVYANAELFSRQYAEASERGILRAIAPTDWEQHRLGPSEVLPMPVARDRLGWHPRCVPAQTFLHVSATPFHDRNGTDLVYDAVAHYKAVGGPPIRLLMSGPRRPDTCVTRGPVTIEPLWPSYDYWRLYARADCLILPRRYGGLSLVMREAIAAGVPVLALDRHPEATWGGVATIPVVATHPQPMKGGQIPVCAADPAHLAALMVRAATTDMLDHLGAEAEAFAETISWRALLPAWKNALEVA